MKTVKRIVQATSVAAVLVLAGCEKDSEENLKDSGYTISVMADVDARKSSAASDTVRLLNGFVNVTEVDLEQEEETDSTKVETEIDIEGLYKFDLMTGVSTPPFPVGKVPPGVYEELEIEMGDDDDLALYAEAEYTDTANVKWPIKISITEELSIEVEDEVNGIQVSANAVQQLDVTISMTNVLSAIDWSQATVTNGSIVVDEQNNTAIYNQMVSLLNIEIEVEDND